VLHKLGEHPEWLALYDHLDSPPSTALSLPEPGDVFEQAHPPSSPGLELVSSEAGTDVPNEVHVPVTRTKGRATSAVDARADRDSESSGDSDEKSVAGSEPDEEDDEDETAGLDFTEH
jgi:hypothetical protein